MTARIPYKNFTQNINGAVTSGVDVEVRRKLNGATATLYAAATGTAEVSNPLTSDADGSFEFWVDPDYYTIEIGPSGDSETYDLPLLWAQKTNYATWPQLEADVDAGAIWPEGTVISVLMNSRILQFASKPGSTDIPALPGLTWVLPIRPDHFAFNEVPGTTDMTAAWLSAAAQGEVDPYATEYLVTEPVVFAKFHSRLVCTTGLATIVGSHADGPIVHFRDGSSAARDIQLKSAGARLVAPYKITAPGFLALDATWDNPTLDPQANCAFLDIQQCRAYDQPGSGLLSFAQATVVRNNAFQENRGHGIHWEPGPGYDAGLEAADLGFPGYSMVAENKLADNAGHSIFINGQAGTNPVYRMMLFNNDGVGGATNSDILQADRGAYIVGENIVSMANGFNEKGVFFGGQQIRSINDRFPGITKSSIGEIKNANGYTCKDIRIEGADINSPSATIVNAWEIESSFTPGANEIVIDQAQTGNETHILSAADRDRVMQWRYGGSRQFNGLTRFPAGEITPTVRFAANGDFAPTYAVQYCSYERVGRRAFIDLYLRFSTNAYTTASGEFIIDLPGLPFALRSTEGERSVVPVGATSNWNSPVTAYHVFAEPLSGSALGVKFAIEQDAVFEANTGSVEPSTSQIAIRITGPVLVEEL